MPGTCARRNALQGFRANTDCGCDQLAVPDTIYPRELYDFVQAGDLRTLLESSNPLPVNAGTVNDGKARQFPFEAQGNQAAPEPLCDLSGQPILEGPRDESTTKLMHSHRLISR